MRIGLAPATVSVATGPTVTLALLPATEPSPPISKVPLLVQLAPAPETIADAADPTPPPTLTGPLVTPAPLVIFNVPAEPLPLGAISSKLPMFQLVPVPSTVTSP